MKTCKKCKIGLLVGKALQHFRSDGTPAVPVRPDVTGSPWYAGTAVRLVQVLKCPECGHSESNDG